MLAVPTRTWRAGSDRPQTEGRETSGGGGPGADTGTIRRPRAPLKIAPQMMVTRVRPPCFLLETSFPSSPRLGHKDGANRRVHARTRLAPRDGPQPLRLARPFFVGATDSNLPCRNFRDRASGPPMCVENMPGDGNGPGPWSRHLVSVVGSGFRRTAKAVSGGSKFHAPPPRGNSGRNRDGSSEPRGRPQGSGQNSQPRFWFPFVPAGPGLNFLPDLEWLPR